MIVMGIVFVLCIYVAALIGKFFKLNDSAIGGLCLWVFLFAMFGLFYLMSLPHGY